MANTRNPNKASGIDDAVELFHGRLDDFIGDVWEGQATLSEKERLSKVAGIMMEFCELLDYVDHRTSVEAGGTREIQGYLGCITQKAVEVRKDIQKPKGDGPKNGDSNLYFLRPKK